MPTYVATLLGALIGALIGSVGAVLIRHWLTIRREENRAREELVQRHLFQLQDATESLWFRLHNLAFRGGVAAMRDPKYFKITTLYALGKLLAVERIFALEGIYPQLDAAYGESSMLLGLKQYLWKARKEQRPKLGKFLREHRTDLRLRHIRTFQQGDRIFLAEAVIEGERERFRTSTFVEFVKRYEAADSPEKEWLDLIWLKVKDDKRFWRQMVELFDHLHDFGQRIWEDTDLYSRFLDRYDENSEEYDNRLERLKDETEKDSIVDRIYTQSRMIRWKGGHEK
jgi:hypothetical protein